MLGMNISDCISDCVTKPVRHSWLIFCLALILTGGAVLLQKKNPHYVSAAEYATLMFDGLVNSNAAHYGSFTITNHHHHPLHFHVNNIEIMTSQGWKYFASWSPGGPRTNSMLGTLENHVAPGETHTFLVRCPGGGDAWRIHVGVLRGIRGLTLKNRATILFKTLSPAAAFTSNPSLTTGYHHFTFAGMLDGPDIPSKAQPNGPANGSQPIGSETNRMSSAAGSRR